MGDLRHRPRYVYADVPPDVFDAFKTAESRGGFFNHEIRDRYAFREVTPGLRR